MTLPRGPLVLVMPEAKRLHVTEAARQEGWFAASSSSSGPFLVITQSFGSVVFILGAAFFAALVRGFAGFGAALIFIPLASAAIGPREASPILLLVDMVLTTAMLPNAWRFANRKEVGTMAAGAIVGVPAGAAILAWAPATVLRWAICAIVLLLLAFLISGWRYHGRPRPKYTAGVGLIAGLFSGAAQLGGPPVAAYWLGGGHEGKIVRSNIILYFAISSVFSFVSYLMGGLIGWEVLAIAILAAPCYALGLAAGSHLFGFASEKMFRTICFVLIAISAIAGMPLLDGLFG